MCADDYTHQVNYPHFQIVDECTIGKKPSNLYHTKADALPLTTLTACEKLLGKYHDCQ